MALPFLIGETWLEGGGEAVVSVNPADGSENPVVSSPTPAEVDRAVEVARSAALDPAWRRMKPHLRAGLLRRIADLIDERRESYAWLQVPQNGKPIRECRQQAHNAAACFRYFAAVCETMETAVTPPRGDYVSLTVNEPMGVVAAITPWNSPITMEAQKIAPALAAGNAVIVKPSELTSLCALELGRIAQRAGAPPGVLGILPGRGAAVGAALVDHPGIDMVSFTGGTETGRAILARASQRLLPVALELGGKSPNIVFADADLDEATGRIASGIFASVGQSCVAGSRLYVQRPLYDTLVRRLIEAADAFTLGPPEREETVIGPLVSFEHRDKVAGYVERARAEGGEVLIGGQVPEVGELARGAYYPPTILAGLAPDSRVIQEEIFGPVLCVLPFDDAEDAIAQANGTIYGLACGVWSGDFAKAWRVARAVDAGTVWVNTYKEPSISTPFGGFKQSGLGREKGVGGVRLYQQTKSIFLAC